MRKWYVWILAMFLLCSCGAQPTFETVSDDDSLMVSAQSRQISLSLPKEAAKPVMESSDGAALYLCNGYTLAIETFSGGDLDRTLQQLTGYHQDQLQLIQTKTADAIRYDLAWTSVSELGDQVARAVILDDGVNHYAVSVMADAQSAGQLQDTWQNIMSSVTFDTD